MLLDREWLLLPLHVPCSSKWCLYAHNNTVRNCVSGSIPGEKGKALLHMLNERGLLKGKGKAGSSNKDGPTERLSEEER